MTKETDCVWLCSQFEQLFAPPPIPDNLNGGNYNVNICYITQGTNTISITILGQTNQTEIYEKC